jgi:hypothetical protein
MQDEHEHLEQPLRDAARAYHEPPPLDAPARDAMWAAIDAQRTVVTPIHRKWHVRPWMGLAAALIIGIGIGRFAPGWGASASRPETPVATLAAGDRLPVPAVYESTTSQYLGQTAALLLALPTAARGGRADGQFISKAQNLLLTTRLLLDSPAAQDAKLRGLLDDLELVLAQVVRLQSEQNASDLDLINQALEQHDVLPRLRTAAADISAD